tara:strand:+ start:169 stop:594 length:426 start_codon:yes stop_codon:yes gene_type:complete
MKPDHLIKRLHHVGIAVKDITSSTKEYSDIFGFKKESEVVLERNQKVYVQFMVKDDIRIELLQPSCKNSPISNFIKKGGIINHLCYETDNLIMAMEHIKINYNSIVVYGPDKSLSLSNCDYAFLAKPSGEVIELVSFGSSS